MLFSRMFISQEWDKTIGDKRLYELPSILDLVIESCFDQQKDILQTPSEGVFQALSVYALDRHIKRPEHLESYLKNKRILVKFL